MYESITQWATILSPIIAVILAWWTCRSGARDTAKLVNCAKKLMLIKLQVKILELSKEAKEEHAEWSSLFNKSKDLNDIIHSDYFDWTNETIRQYEEKRKDVDNTLDLNFDRRKVIGETMTDLIKMIKEIERM